MFQCVLLSPVCSYKRVGARLSPSGRRVLAIDGIARGVGGHCDIQRGRVDGTIPPVAQRWEASFVQLIEMDGDGMVIDDEGLLPLGRMQIGRHEKGDEGESCSHSGFLLLPCSSLPKETEQSA